MSSLPTGIGPVELQNHSTIVRKKVFQKFLDVGVEKPKGVCMCLLGGERVEWCFQSVNLRKKVYRYSLRSTRPHLSHLIITNLDILTHDDEDRDDNHDDKSSQKADQSSSIKAYLYKREQTKYVCCLFVAFYLLVCCLQILGCLNTYIYDFCLNELQEKGPEITIYHS